MAATHDYHGLSVENAISRFVADYYTALHLEVGRRELRVVHGYIHGDAIKRTLRRLLEFEMRHGALVFTASEEVSNTFGYSLVTPVKPLLTVPLGLFDTCFDRISFLADVVNDAIERTESQKQAVVGEEAAPTLPPAALDALNRLRTATRDDIAGN